MQRIQSPIREAVAAISVCALMIAAFGCRRDEPAARQGEQADEPQLVRAELKFDAVAERALAETREAHRLKMAAIEAECLPALAKFPCDKSSPKAGMFLPDQSRGNVAAFSPTEPILVIAQYYGGFSIWDLKAARRLHNVERKEWNREIVFSSDGRRMLIVPSSNARRRPELKIYDVREGSIVCSLRLPDAKPLTGFTGAGFGLDGKTILTTSGEPDLYTLTFGLQRWDANTGALLSAKTPLRDAKSIPGDFVFSPDSTKMAGVFKTSIGEPGRLVVLRTSDAAVLRDMPVANSDVCLAFSPDGWRLAAGVEYRPNLNYQGATFRIIEWDLKNGLSTEWNPGGTSVSIDVAYSADGKKLYIDDPPRVLDIEQNMTFRFMTEYVGRPALAVSPGGRLLADGRRIFDVAAFAAKKE